jgi:metallophosphoesterase (TIGR03768 family)
MSLCKSMVRPASVLFAVMVLLQLGGCVAEWPIAKDVYTTAEQQLLPVALPADTPAINPKDVALYAEFGYSAWHTGPGTDYSKDPAAVQPHDKRAELAPAYTGAPNAASLLSFFAITDIHITDKESPAQAIYPGWSATPEAPYLLNSSYSPIILSTTQVLDAAIQTVNALNKKSPIDFGISLGDDINNTQYNELRWFIDVMDGKVITPSSGAHAGADTIDYQKPFKAVGLDIPWYQVLGNHDQYFTGLAYETKKTRAAHVGNTVINMAPDALAPGWNADTTGAYMGVVDGTTPYGDIIGAGLEALFPTPPKVVADKNRRSLSTTKSTSRNWMREFFDTTSEPFGHGFSRENLDKDFACYTFEPKSEIPIRILALDDTNKPSATETSQQYIGGGGLDQARHDWLLTELQKGQNEGKLMIIAAHIPILPLTDLTTTDPTDVESCFGNIEEEKALLATLRNYPNLLMVIAGHRHLNTVTPQTYDPTVPGQGPENSFWEVETASLRDFPQQLRVFDICRNSDNTVSVFVTNVDPAVSEGSPAAKSRNYALGLKRIYGASATTLADTTSHAYNAELVKQLTPEMQAIIANCGTPLE